jgi:beta-lactamase superfamily II metal-dependent hydrolase
MNRGCGSCTETPYLEGSVVNTHQKGRKAMFEVDFLPVGNSNGDAICIQYSLPGGVYVHVVDGGFTDTGQKIIDHIKKYYGANYTITHMVLSHADNDHATGLIEVMKSMKVHNLWMNRPWLYAKDTIQHFHGRYTLDGLVEKMREMHPYLVVIEELAAKQGTAIHDVFQGDKIGNFTVLAPSRERYIRLIPDLNKTPPRHSAADTSLGTILGEALKRVRDYLYESWDIETLSNDPDPTSASNETSVVQMGVLDGQHVLLTADVGPEGLNEAADYAKVNGLLGRYPHMVQVPHHGSRRNVTPQVLDRLIGGLMPEGQSYGTAICSIGKDKDEFPRGQVNNAFLRRGYPVYVTRDNIMLYHSGGNERGWGNGTPLPFAERVEDKAKSAAAA